jgi:hypothetical protein
MLAWCIVIFVLGVLSFVDALFGEWVIFRQANSFLLMLVSLGLLIRVSLKQRAAHIEKMEARLSKVGSE